MLGHAFWTEGKGTMARNSWKALRVEGKLPESKKPVDHGLEEAQEKSCCNCFVLFLRHWACSLQPWEWETDLVPLLALTRRGAAPVKTGTGNDFPQKYQRILRNDYQHWCWNSVTFLPFSTALVIFTLWHEITTKINPWKFFFVVCEGFELFKFPGRKTFSRNYAWNS